MLVSDAAVDERDDGVVTRFSSTGTVGGEEDGSVRGDAGDDDGFPVGPPGGPDPLGNDKEGAGVVSPNFLENAVEEGPGWVDVGADLVPAVGNRVASKGVGVIGIGGEVVG